MADESPKLITTNSLVYDTQMEKYIALRVMIAKITNATNFITVFKTTYLSATQHFYTYIFDLEINDCTSLFTQLLTIFRIQLYGNTYRTLTKRYFMVSNKDNHYFFNHLHKHGITIYVFNNSMSFKRIKEMSKSDIDIHRVLRKTIKNKTTTVASTETAFITTPPSS